MPPSVARATFATAVTVDKLANGVFWAGGGPANSYMVEFRDFAAGFEPGGEERSLAAIEAIAKLAPRKPIRWLISSHPHSDHIGGLRAYLHIGATIVAHIRTSAFESRRTQLRAAHRCSGHRVSLASDGALGGLQLRSRPGEPRHHGKQRILRDYYVQPLQHVEGMLMAYLLAERIAFQADLFDTHEPPRTAQLRAMGSLTNHVLRMKLEVETLAPVHGTPVPWSTFDAALKTLASARP